MTPQSPGRPTVVVAGGGVAGTLVALHLVRASGRRSTGLDLVVVDPGDRLGPGVAFDTPDERHLLNVPAAGMSALPEEPGHFVSWRRRCSTSSPVGDDAAAARYEFAPRREFARYLAETLTDALAASAGQVSLRHVRRQATGLARTADGVTLTLDDGSVVDANGAVVATGLPAAGHAWAPASLRDSAFFVPDPWAPGALDVVRRSRTGPPDVLVVGTGLTMVDVTIGLAAPGRTVHAVSRRGRLPHVHAEQQQLAAIPDVEPWGRDLASIRLRAQRHITDVEQATGDWRPAMDGLRFQVSTLWSRLSDDERREFLATDAGRWNNLRHRMPTSSALHLDALRASGRLETHSGQVASAEPLTGGGLRVTLDDGSVRDVGWVVNCTGPQLDVSTLGNPLIDDLLRPRGGASLAVLSTAGMGFRTDDGRLIDSAGTAGAPVWTLGALRRGELWESTAVPEIRTQARALAASVLDVVAPLPRVLADGRVVSGRHPIARPRDPLGLPISTNSDAAAAFNAGLERIMRLQSGGEELLLEAVGHDPDFALGHAALAMLGHEVGAAVDVQASLEQAQRAVRARGDERERSFVDVVTRRVDDVRRTGASALMAHIARHPRDVLAVSAAVPTIAFSGVTDVQQEAWDLVEGLAPAYGDHWWYISLLAFTRQDQSRWDEAGLLAESALSCEPSSGHAVHAQTHVLYETGKHETGRVWLDHWVAESGRSASHRAHFSWHAALHELAMGDTEAVRARYYSQLAPPTVSGVRSLIDSASLLWRWRVTTSAWAGSQELPPPPIEPILAGLDAALVDRPETPFVALHSAFALAAVGDLGRLTALSAHCARSTDPVVRTTIVAVCQALVAASEGRDAVAAELLTDVLPSLARVGGSAAQREIVEETLLLCLLNDGQVERVADLLHARTDRRPSPLDTHRARALADVGVGGALR